MAFKKFDCLEDAIMAGYCIQMGNGEYAQGGETVSRERYQALFKAVEAKNPHDTVQPFILPKMKPHYIKIK